MNENSNNQPRHKISKKEIIRWVLGIMFAIFAKVNGLHFSSFLLLIAAALMLPIPFIEQYLQKINIKKSVAVALSVILFFVAACVSPSSSETDDTLTDNNIKEINFFSNKEVVLKVGTEKNNGYANVTFNSQYEFSVDDVVFVSENPEIATIEFTNVVGSHYLYYKIKGISKGETYVYVKTVDGNVVSDKIKVTVESKTQSTTSTTTTTITTTPGKTTTTTTTQKNQGQTNPPEDKVEYVWIPNSGSKYHSNSSCSNMSNPRKVTLAQAQQMGYTPCKKCH